MGVHWMPITRGDLSLAWHITTLVENACRTSSADPGTGSWVRREMTPCLTKIHLGGAPRNFEFFLWTGVLNLF